MELVHIYCLKFSIVVKRPHPQQVFWEEQLEHKSK